jgi:hypothetical protein|tara:strand:+ start:381 stop:596 length:216 start_codon:yes stop_codon:yes gene_type:complete
METEQTNNRTYKTIKWVLRGHIKNNVKSLWTYEDDNFTCIYKNYSNSSSIYTPEQMLTLIDGLILEEKKND